MSALTEPTPLAPEVDTSRINVAIRKGFFWRNDDCKPVPNTWTYFRKEIDYFGGDTICYFAADPTARLYINGTVVIDRVMRFVTPHITVERLDLSPSLKIGRNIAVILHHWWGVGTFQRSPGGSPGVSIVGPCLNGGDGWKWRNADEFVPVTTQTTGGGTFRIRFPLVADYQYYSNPHKEGQDGQWKPTNSVRNEAWSVPVLKGFPPVAREECRPVRVVATGTVIPLPPNGSRQTPPPRQ